MAKDDITTCDNICDYNAMFAEETLNPLVSVVDFSKMVGKSVPGKKTYGFYLVMLKDTKCADILYGRNMYDFQEGTLLFLAPGQVLDVKNPPVPVAPKGYALAFHPDLLRGKQLGRNIHDYNFFSYDVHEALHISQQERNIVTECLANIRQELQHAIDKHSRQLIVSNIELLLNYCVRFYDRQFITRERVNADVITQFERLVLDYYRNGNPERHGMLTVAQCAQKLNLSANYFGDLVKKETGKTALEFIQSHVISLAKERIFDTSKSISEIAYGLGFNYPQHFTRFFKTHVGMTPNQYRMQS